MILDTFPPEELSEMFPPVLPLLFLYAWPVEQQHVTQAADDQAVRLGAQT